MELTPTFSTREEALRRARDKQHNHIFDLDFMDDQADEHYSVDVSSCGEYISFPDIFKDLRLILLDPRQLDPFCEVKYQ